MCSLKNFVRSHVGWKGERNISYKGVETSPVRLMAMRNKPKQIIFASGGLGRLQMVSNSRVTEKVLNLNLRGR